MAVRRRSGPKMRSSPQGDGAGSRESKQMITPTLGTNANLVSPPYACRKSGNDYGYTRRKWSAISFRRWGTTSGERPFAFSARMRIPVRKRQIFISATLPGVIVQHG